MREQVMLRRLRRNRHLSATRDLFQETHVLPSNLIMPLFLLEGKGRRENISSMPGISRLSLDLLCHEVAALLQLGVKSINLYPVVPPEYKDRRGSFALSPEGFYLQAIQCLKKEFPQLCIISDVALDPYTDHGHDGVIDEKGSVLNDETVMLLAEMARLHAFAGADIVAPSDMMDGRVFAMRQVLDRAGFCHVGIIAYTAKYASSLYRPFREALHSAPRFGDKKTYQMNSANIREACVECSLDINEGADAILVKPALPYLDVISRLRQMSSLPLIAYQVSGEYAMIMAASQQGWLEEIPTLYECVLSIKRAGADSIITYGAKQLAQHLKKLLS